MNLLRLPGHADRRWLFALLVLANTPSILAFNAVLYFGPGRGAPPPGWLLTLMLGVITGQAILMAFWISLSRDTLWFRLAVFLATLITSGLVTSLVIGSAELQMMFQRYPFSLPQMDWYVVAQTLLIAFARIGGVAFAWFTLAYAILLPIRRLTGISLGTAGSDPDAPPPRRQFQIYEWMIWTAIVATPFLFVRLATFDESDALMPISLAVVILQLPLLLAWPVFQAALAPRNALLWSFGTLSAFAATAFVVCEGAYWIDLDRLSRSPGLTNAMFNLWAWEIYLLSAGGALSLNGLILRGLGFRLRRS